MNLTKLVGRAIAPKFNQATAQIFLRTRARLDLFTWADFCRSVPVAELNRRPMTPFNAWEFMHHVNRSGLFATAKLRICDGGIG